MTNTRLCTSISSLAVAAAMASQPLLAEDRADAEGFTLEEITVTAQKRAKSLLDVPISINAITGDIIRKSNITDIRGLMSLAPTLNVTQSAAPGDVIVAIRGLGTSSFNIGIEPSVGIFVDGVYRARTGTAIGDFLSLERAEILRGPQSTLFGKNTSAGVISFVTKKPEYDAGGMVSATYGNYDQVIVKGTVTGPIVDDKVAFRLSGNVNSRSGFITNLFDGSEVNDKDRWALRGQLLFELSETVSVRMIADYSQIDERCCAAPFVFNGPTQGAIAALGGTVIGPINAPSTPFDRRVSFDGILNTTMDDFGFSAEVTVDLDGFEITSITAYRDFQTAVDIDTDYTDIDITVRNGSESAIQIFTQEVRFTSTEDTVVDWMAGGFYSNQSLDSLGWSLYGADTRPYFDLLAGFGTIVPGFGNLDALEQLILGFPAGTFFAEGTGQVSEAFDTKSESFAVFAQVDFHISDQTTLTGGLRYTKENKDATGTFDVQDTLAALDLNTLFGGAFIGFSGLQIFSPLRDFDRSRSEDKLTGNAIVSHSWSDQFNTYASFSVGYKAGGFNVSRGASNNVASDDNQFEFFPENVTAFEVGAKVRFWEGRGQMNAALYHQKVKDFQASVFNGIGFELSNAGSITVKGFELDSSFALTENLSASLAFSYNDAAYEVFVNAPCPSGVAPPCDLSGETLPDAPKWTVSASSDYVRPLTDSLNGFIRGEIYYMGERNVGDALSDLTVQEATTMVNASLGIRSVEATGWEVSLWVRNLTKTDYLQSIFNSVAQAGSLSGFPNDPRTYGITARLNF